MGEKIKRSSKGKRAAEILNRSQHLLVYRNDDGLKTFFYGKIFDMLIHVVAQGLCIVYGNRETNIEKLMNEVRKKWREEEKTD